MDKIYLVKGLDCANCAREFEEKVNKINGINKATMNFMTSKLIVDSNEDLILSIQELGKNFEDGLKIKRIK